MGQCLQGQIMRGIHFSAATAFCPRFVCLVLTLQKNTIMAQEKIDLENKVMNQNELPDSYQDEIREYFKKVQQTKNAQEEFYQFFEIISPSLRVKV